MELDEAIKHAEEVAEKKEKKVKRFEDLEEYRALFSVEENECKQCAEEHRQLAEWLKDYKRLKEQQLKPMEKFESAKDYYEALDMEMRATEQEPKTGKWIELEDFDCSDRGEYLVKCSICSSCNGYSKSNYCPSCGAKMESEG